MMYKFLCQGCLNVVESEDWNYYHLEDDSCPVCHSEMCGCPSCVQFIEEKQLSAVNCTNG